ncbi:MAG: T9SS type A sorting domain-containing protein [Bacteroidota bacterium]|nr:T9SS type A sorting domain-containing protein [Bacteroidota bacterium]
MFHPEGGDSAYVKIVLFNYDSIAGGPDTVGFAVGYMHEEITSFTQFSLPIQYLNESIPASMHIFFSTSKTASDQYIHGFGPPSGYASEGTSLWLDDVQLNGTTSISERVELETLTVFPNPAGDRIWFYGQSIEDDLQVVIFDAKGVQVLDERIRDLQRGLDVSDLCSGMYSFVLQPRDQRSIRAAWLKE